MEETPMIQQISSTEFNLVKGGHDMTLTLGKWGWEMTTFNACTRAYNNGFGGFRRFKSLAEVEAAYKSWRGISALVEVA
jgi:hypothetical protein